MKNLKKIIFLGLFLAQFFVCDVQSQRNLFSVQMENFFEYAKEQGVNSVDELKKDIDKYKNKYPDLLEIISDKIGREGREKINYVYQKKLWNWGFYPRKEEIEELTSQIHQVIYDLVNVYDDSFYKELRKFLLHCNPSYSSDKNVAGILLDKIEKYYGDERENLMRYVSARLTLEDKQNIRDRFMPKPPTKEKRALPESADLLVEKLSTLVSNFEETQKAEAKPYLAEQQRPKDELVQQQQKEAEIQARLETERKTKELEAQKAAQARLANEQMRQDFIARRRAVSVAPAVTSLDIFKLGIKSLLEHEISQNNTSANMLEQQMQRHVGGEYISLLKFVYDNLSLEDKQKINDIYMHKQTGFGYMPRADEIKPLIGKLRLYTSQFESGVASNKNVKAVQKPVGQKPERPAPKKQKELEKARVKYEQAKKEYEQFQRDLGIVIAAYKNTSSSSSGSSSSSSSPRGSEESLPENFSQLDEQNKIKAIINLGEDLLTDKYAIFIANVLLYGGLDKKDIEERANRYLSKAFEAFIMSQGKFGGLRDQIKAADLSNKIQLTFLMPQLEQAYQDFEKNFEKKREAAKKERAAIEENLKSLSMTQKKKLKELKDQVTEALKKVEEKEKELKKAEKGKDKK